MSHRRVTGPEIPFMAKAEDRPIITPSPQPTALIPLHTDGPIDPSSAIPSTTVPIPPIPPLVAFSDGSQAVDGRAILAGLPLPDGYRLADFGPGFAQGPVAACTGCGRGTIIYQNGKPQHRGCPTEEDITRARR